MNGIASSGSGEPQQKDNAPRCGSRGVPLRALCTVAACLAGGMMMGYASAPSVALLGAGFPWWLFCIAIGVSATVCVHRHWYVITNFRETDLQGLRPATAATLYIMSDTGRKFRGRVDSVASGVLPDDGALVLEGLPRVQGSINRVQVQQLRAVDGKRSTA